MSYTLNWAPIWASRDLIISGFLMTVALSAVALIGAVIIGTAVGTAGSMRQPFARRLAVVYVEVIRNIPLLIHMYFWYMGLAFLRLPPFVCAVLGLSLYSGAYVAEIVRAGIGAVPRGQRMAALASGLTAFQALRLVIYPQALRIVAPSLASLFSQLIKDSSLASIIAVAEITYEAGAIEGTTFRTFEIYITVAALYLVLVTLTSHVLLMVPGAREDALARSLSDA